jgi:hypothetical protein
MTKTDFIIEDLTRVLDVLLNDAYGDEIQYILGEDDFAVVQGAIEFFINYKIAEGSE